MNRCQWVNLKNPLDVRYHDEEWSRPLHEDNALFELLILEMFQAGLSWEIVLNKRQAFRAAFDEFDPALVAHYSPAKIEQLMRDPGIIRNRRKIEASIHNAQIFMEIQQLCGSFDAYIWSFTQGKSLPEPYTQRTSSPLSEQITKDLRKRGMRFVGPTIIYSYLQAIGVLLAHGEECELRVL